MHRAEDYVQSTVRLEAAKRGMILWRNNVGVLRDGDGRPVRFGLANDSKAVNASIKSSDLIGVRVITITPEMVGRKVGIFAARECKAEGWRYSATPEEQAQLKFITLVNDMGGDACFASSADGVVNPAYENRYGR